jgi:hypothetical protein
MEGEADDVIVVDDTYFPIIVSTWFGAPTERAVRSYFAWLDEVLGRATRGKVPLVNVTDSGNAGVPTAAVRRLIADLTKQWEASGATAARVTSFVVVDNAIIRGVLRALAWLHGDLKSPQYATCAAALTAALEVLARAECKAPAGLVPSAWRRLSKIQRTVERPQASLRR